MKFILAAVATLLGVSVASAERIYVEPGPPAYVEPAPHYVIPGPVVTERTYVVRRPPAVVVEPRPYVVREYVPRVVVDPYW